MNMPSTDSSVEPSPLFIAFRTFPFMSILVLSLLGNSLIIISFALNETNIRAKQPIDVFIINLAVLGLLECLITQPISCGCSVEGSWIFGRFLINLNSAFVQMKNIGVTLTISAIVVDRYVAITRGNETNYRVHYANYAILYSWMHSLAFALPLVFQSKLFEVTSRPFLERCLCGLTERTSLSFTLTLACLCYGSPLLAIAVVLPLAFRKISLERRKGKGSVDSTIYNFVESRVAKETQNWRFSVLLTVSYLIFVCPYLTMDVSTQLGFKSAFVPTPSNTTQMGRQLNYTISYQTVLVWLMFLFSAVFPFLTFYSFRGRWQNIGTTFKRSFLQSNQNSMRSIPRRAVHRQQIEQSNRRRRQQKRRPLRKSSLDRRRRKICVENSYAYKRRRNPTTPTTTSDGASCSGISETRVITSEAPSFNVSGRIRLRIPTLVPTVDGLKVQSHEETIMTPQLHKEIYKSSSDRENIGEFSGSCTAIELNCNKQQTGIIRIRPQQMETRLHRYIPPKFSDEDAGYIGSDLEESDLNLSGNSTTLILPFSSKSLIKKDSSPSGNKHYKGETSGECSGHISSPSTCLSQTCFVDMETARQETSLSHVTVEEASPSNKVDNVTEMKFFRPRRISAWSASLDGQLNSGGKHSFPSPSCRDGKSDT